MSGETAGEGVDVRAVIDAGAAGASGVAHAEELVAFADALVQGSDEELAAARAGVLAALGPAGLVDTAGVASNFERMVRIADATGIPLDAPVNAMTADLRAELGIDAFGSSANTPPPGALERGLGRVLGRFAARAMGPLSHALARLSR